MKRSSRLKRQEDGEEARDTLPLLETQLFPLLRTHELVNILEEESAPISKNNEKGTHITNPNYWKW